MITQPHQVFLVASALVEIGALQKDSYLTETLSWITVSQSLLEKTPLHNFQARRALKAIDALRNVILAASSTHNSQPTLGLNIDPELVRLAEVEPIPFAAMDAVSTDDILDRAIPIPIGCPEIDLLSDENFVDRVQCFLDSWAASPQILVGVSGTTGV